MSDAEEPGNSPAKLRSDLSPVDMQKRQLEKLMANPTKPVYVPEAPQVKQVRPARDMMRNVMGSSAGAGSGEFHIYKHARRREYERLALMDEEERQQKEKEANLQRQAELDAINDARALKNKAKRDKKKARRQKSGPAAVGRQEAGDDSGEGEEDAPASKKPKMAASGATLTFREESGQPSTANADRITGGHNGGGGISVVDDD